MNLPRRLIDEIIRPKCILRPELSFPLSPLIHICSLRPRSPTQDTMASSSCPARSDRAFGPRVDPVCRTFDFTILFEDIFFSCVPTAVFFLLLPFHVGVLVKSRAVCSVRSKLLFGKLVGSVSVYFGVAVPLIPRYANTWSIRRLWLACS